MAKSALLIWLFLIGIASTGTHIVFARVAASAEIDQGKRFEVTDGDSVGFRSNLTGFYAWNIVMYNRGTEKIRNPTISVLTTLCTGVYSDPKPYSFDQEGRQCRYKWQFPTASPGTEQPIADIYFESNASITFSPDFDSARSISPAAIANAQDVQTVTVMVRPHRSFQSITVRIGPWGTEAEQTNSAFLSAPSVPISSELSKGKNWASFWTPQPTLSEYQFIAKFIVKNMLYPDMVLHKPYIGIYAVYSSKEQTFTSARSINATDPMLGEITYSAESILDWNYGANQKYVLYYPETNAYLHIAQLTQTLQSITPIVSAENGSLPSDNSQSSFVQTQTQYAVGIAGAGLIAVAALFALKRKRPLEDKTKVY